MNNEHKCAQCQDAQMALCQFWRTGFVARSSCDSKRPATNSESCTLDLKGKTIMHVGMLGIL